MFDIANVAFSQVSDREKKAYEGKVKETGSYQGYKLRQYWVYYLQLFVIHQADPDAPSTSTPECGTRSNITTVRARPYSEKGMYNMRDSQQGRDEETAPGSTATLPS